MIQLGLTWTQDPLPPWTSGTDMGELELKSATRAIAVLRVGRRSIVELAGSTLALIPSDVELEPDVFA